MVRSPRGRRTAAGVGEALLSALPPWRRGVWCGMTEPGVLARKPAALPVRPRARHDPLALLHLTPAETVLCIHGIRDLAYLKTPAGAVCVCVPSTDTLVTTYAPGVISR